jgi:hypothetical protein
MRIKLGNSLSAFQKMIIRRKLSNLDEISPVPIVVKQDEVVIGIGAESTEEEIWEDLYRKLGYRAHCV